MADAGFKLSVEGEKEFKKALAEINNQIKANAAELKMLTAQYTSTDSSMEKLTANQRALEASLETQGQKVALLREQYEKAAAEYGETDSKVVKLKTDLANATVEYSKMSAEVEANQKAIDANWKSMEKQAGVSEEMQGAVSGLDAALKKNREEVEALAEQYRLYQQGAVDTAKKQENLTAQNKLLSDSVEAQRKKIAGLNEDLKTIKKLYGDNSDEVRDYQKQVDEATAELKEMQEQMKRNEEELSDSGESANGLLEALEEAGNALGVQIPDGIKNVIGGFDDATVAAAGISGAIAGAVLKLNELSASTREWADELTTKAQEMNINTESYQALEYAVNALGVESDTIQDAIKEINNRAGETDKVIREQIGTLDNFSDATDDQKKAVFEAMKQWDELGVSIYDTTTGALRPANEILYDLVDAYGNITNATERSYRMNDMFGESYRKLNPLIEAGTDNIKRLEEEAYKLGVVMDDVMVAKMDGAAAAAERYMKIIGSLGRKVGAAWMEMYSLQGAMKNIEDLITFVQSLFGGGKSNVPAHATGTYNHIGGYALVGEKGPEIVQLPQGSRVFPNGQAPAGGSTVNNYSITIDAKNVQEFNDIVRIVKGANQAMRRG